MYYALAALAAVLIAVMLAVNGALTDACGIHLATLLIHAVGLCAVSAAALLRRERPFRRARGLPAALFLGGVIGYFTTLFNVMALGKISVTAILALSLLGQAATSLVIDQFGLFGMPVRPFSVSRLPGLCATVAGIAVLLWGSSAGALVPALVSLLTGATVVTSRQINAQLSARTSVVTGTFFNYVTGLVSAALALGIALLCGAAVPWSGALTPPAWAYLGGAIGAMTVFLSNVVTLHMSSLAMTLIMFAGQVFGGVAIDALCYGAFSWRSLAGGVFAFLGLCLNVWLSARAGKRNRSGRAPE